MGRELGIMGDCYIDGFPAWLETVMRHGFTWIGVNGTSITDAQRIERSLKAIEASGIKRASFHAVASLVPADPADRGPHLERMKRDIDMAAMFGCPVAVFHYRSVQLKSGGWRGAAYDSAAFLLREGLSEFDKRMAENVATICEYAKGQGVGVALENLMYPYTRRTADIVAFIEQLGLDNLGVCFDTGHAHAAERDVAADLLAAAEHLTAVHFHDNFGANRDQLVPDADLHLAPGLGTIPWPAVIQALDQTVYKGPAVFEGITENKLLGDLDLEAHLQLTIANWRMYETLAERIPDCFSFADRPRTAGAGRA